MLRQILFARQVGKLHRASSSRIIVSKKQPYHAKTLAETWIYSDAGALPVLAVIVVAVALPVTFGVYYACHSPDARIWKHDRKSLFRGDVEGK